MLRRSVSFIALFILVLAAASAPACLGITKEFNQTYPLQPGGSFELQNVNGTTWTPSLGWSPWLRATRRMREWRWPWNTRCACRIARTWSI